MDQSTLRGPACAKEPAQVWHQGKTHTAMNAQQHTPSAAGTTRLLRRFLRLLIPAFLLASTLGLYAISALTFGDERSGVATRVSSLASRTATVLNSLPQGELRAPRDSILTLLLSDPAITCAQLIDGDGRMLAVAPAQLGCRESNATATIDSPIRSQSGAVLRVHYNLAELEERSQLFRIFTLLSLLGSLVVAAAASWFSFRLTVGRPVHALLQAIRTTHLLGKPTKVEVVPDDEMGSVILAFNDMQDKLDEEARRNAEALRRLDYIYNETPALMFSIDSKGTIISASGHWLDETGFRRDEIIGAPLRQFISVQAGQDFDASQDAIIKAERPLRDLPFTLTCKNGMRREVLMAVVPDIEANKGAQFCVLSDISGLKEAQVELRRQAVTDHLTHLPNRQGLFEHLGDLKKADAAELAGCALLFIDLDNFKTVNDTLGHDAGDQLLRAAAGRLRNSVSRNDFLARLGGDEFAIVLHGMNSPDDATVVAERIIETFTKPFRLGEASAIVGTSIGIANFADSIDGDDILRLADLAMYQSKQSGRNCVSRYSDDLTAKVVGRDRLLRRIREGLMKQELRFHYQPIVDLETMKPVGIEALLRLDHANGEALSPAEVIRTAEEAGLIGAISTWSLGEGVRIAESEHKSIGGRGRYLSINLSPKQLTQEFVAGIVSRLQEAPEVARSLVFEITETALFRQDEDVGAMIASLRATGARIALDDFGTGFSSLGHLQRFPVDMLKLDSSFVEGLSGDSDDARRRRAVIRATSALAQELNMKIVAEGLEDHNSLNLLKSFGITMGQGYLFSAPAPLRVTMGWIEAFDRPTLPGGNIIPLARANINGR